MSDIAWFHLDEISRMGNSIDMESQLAVTKPGAGKIGKLGLPANEQEVSFGSDGNVLKLGGGDGYTIL